MISKKIYLLSIFFVLFIFWFWSREGVKIPTRIIKSDSVIRIYFDNFLLGTAKDTLSENKKLVVNFVKQDLDNIYFNQQSSVDRDNISLGENDYEIKLFLKNPFLVRLNFEGKHRFVFYFNPYRHLNTGWEDDTNILTDKTTNQVQISFLNGIKWILWIILKPFPLLIPIFILLYFFGRKINENPLNFKLIKKLLIIPLIIIIISFFWSRHLMVNYLGDSPHVPDSISYIILGKIISTGKLIIPYSEIPPIIKNTQISEFLYHWYRETQTGIFVPYLVGHPLILAIGNIFGKMNYIPPLIGSATLLSIFLITYLISQSFIFSLFAMILCLASPFFQTQTIDYMSHNSASLFILLSIIPLFLKKKNTKIYVLMGFFLGMLLNTRPFTFAAVFIVIMLYLFFELAQIKNIKPFILKLFYSGLGAILPVSIFLYYNYISTGRILSTPYQFHGIINKVGFGSDFKISYGLLNTFSNLAVFSLFFLKNYFVGFFPFLLSFLLIPFSGKLSKTIIFLQFLSISIIGIWTLYDGNFFMYGPRFIYEVVPILTILYGITFFVLLSSLKHTNWKYFIYLIIIAFFINIFLFELAWMGMKKTEFSGIAYVPANIIELSNFNNVDQRLFNLYKNNVDKDMIFLMKGRNNWWEYSGVWLNTYPLIKSQPLFISLPDDYKYNLKNSKIIDWNSL